MSRSQGGRGGQESSGHGAPGAPYARRHGPAGDLSGPSFSAGGPSSQGPRIGVIVGIVAVVVLLAAGVTIGTVFLLQPDDTSAGTGPRPTHRSTQTSATRTVTDVAAYCADVVDDAATIRGFDSATRSDLGTMIHAFERLRRVAPTAVRADYRLVVHQLRLFRARRYVQVDTARLTSAVQQITTYSSQVCAGEG